MVKVKRPNITRKHPWCPCEVEPGADGHRAAARSGAGERDTDRATSHERSAGRVERSGVNIVVAACDTEKAGDLALPARSNYIGLRRGCSGICVWRVDNVETSGAFVDARSEWHIARLLKCRQQGCLGQVWELCRCRESV
jgi:hypothetical protein